MVRRKGTKNEYKVAVIKLKEKIEDLKEKKKILKNKSLDYKSNKEIGHNKEMWF